MRQKNSQACRQGFTLIELLIVVGILLLLISILLPSFVEARRQAQRISCSVNLRALGDAMTRYREFWHRYPDVGDRNPAGQLGPTWRTGDPRPPRNVLYSIGDLAEALVLSRLIRPEQMYCPSSLRYDRRAPAPFTDSTGRPSQKWRTGEISYIYLAGIKDEFIDPSTGAASYDPTRESPDRILNRVNARAVLAGDRTVELQPGKKNIPDSNHRREGGWFYFTTGDVTWWSWSRLTSHSAPLYKWYWPGLSRGSPTS